MADPLGRLTAALADRYRIEREPRHVLRAAKEPGGPRAGRPRPAVPRDQASIQRRRVGAPPSAHSSTMVARETRGQRT